MLHREPLRVEDIDMNVVKGMAGFEFGTDQEIYDNLKSALSSESYMRAVQHWERKRRIHGRNGHGGVSNASLVSYNSAVSTSSD